MNKKLSRNSNTSNRRRKPASYDKKEDKVYFEGVVTETLPSVRFKVKIDRKNLEPLILECQTKSILKVKKVKIIKGDFVTVEVDLEDLSKGLIVKRN
ncbi:MAG: translation initiation factor IF-1 [candidate division SR1 bacterium]|nr:translation initiation factor IF-1 [candidate division SR1 bacterium]